jgi:serine/threonine-protein kinase
VPAGDPPVGDQLIGRVIGDRYRITAWIGAGTRGTVYEAEHALIGKRIALKVLHPELARDPELAARFLQEAKAASRIGHENVIDISAFGQSPEGLVYVAMELLDGQDLGRLLAANGGALPWPRARPILMQITKALRAAHEHGLIHRDLKPANVFIMQRRGDARPDFVKVMDFGPARGPARSGTPAYTSPEQAEGRPIDHRSDVYAVGCLMYEVLTGSPPFSGADAAEILRKQASEAPVSLRVQRPDVDIPPGADAAALRALAKDPDRRWEDMDAFYRALGTAGGEPFETSGVHVRNPSLQFPAVLDTGTVARISSAEVSGPPPAAPSEGADDERPVARSRAGIKLGMVFVAVAAVAALVLTVLRLAARP